MLANKLQYRISNLHQLSQCLSNNSRLLHIEVADLFQDDRISGVLVSVKDDSIGTLFATLVNGYGDILTPDSSGYYHEMTISDLLKELYKFGFIVEFQEEENLPGDQISYLMTLKDLGFDKIRFINVYRKVIDETVSKRYLVVFNASKNPNWVHIEYSPSESEFLKRLDKGHVLNITDVSSDKHFRWSWLTFVANIDDVLHNQYRG